MKPNARAARLAAKAARTSILYRTPIMPDGDWFVGDEPYTPEASRRLKEQYPGVVIYNEVMT